MNTAFLAKTALFQGITEQEVGALSNELSKMQKDGLIAFRKNEFTLLG